MKGAQISSVILNARNLYYTLTLDPPSNILTYELLPRSDGTKSYETSTDYFRTLIESGKVNSSFFAAPGIHSPGSDDPEAFQSTNNAWCIVEDLPTSGDVNSPAIFTRNIQIESLNQLARLTDNPPFGQRAGIIVTKGGVALSLDEETINQYFAGQKMTNRVLRP